MLTTLRFPTPRHATCQDGKRRLGIVIDELLHWRPDVLCLQEVSCFSSVLEPLLAREGYVGKFKKRTGDQHLDGCAMFVNTAKFEVRASGKALCFWTTACARFST